MKLIMAAATDVGTVREINEDFFYYSKPGRLMVVCDGMGGHQSGAVASRIAGKTIRDIFFHADFAELARLGEDVIDRLPPLALRLVIGVRLANRRLQLMAERNRQLRGMGTTLVAIAFGENNACAVHVGDSRLYCLRGKSLAPLTEDHSLVNQLLQDRDIRQDQVKQFRKKNVLTRALGTHPVVKVDVQWFPVQAGDMFLLCSDGFHNALKDEQISALLRCHEPDLQKMIDTMVQQAKAANGSDNITAVMTKIEKISGNPDKKDKVKMTIAEESEKIAHFQNKFIQEKYLTEKSSRGLGGAKAKRSWWPLFIGLAGVMITALVYAVIKPAWLVETPREIQVDNIAVAAPEINGATDLVAQNPTPLVAAPPIGGQLVFLHVNDPHHIERLRSWRGVRVLDQFNPDRLLPGLQPQLQQLNRKILTGAYSLVLADSLKNVVYSREGIHLHAFPAIVDTIRAEVPALPPTTEIPVSQNTLSTPRNENVARAEADTSRDQQ
ncbi:MAG: protein phosphatase 2C domain-containing protein [candidate division KSB1 bacterium]|nr:protein phosphatase 2C domain-containing protein [candidate division KSB1 bacterium]MDZ7366637.1 protein phosphatase 2C domain-containing protein [candidate division KSB1 bacterium]MDZ7404648.1 protein phosphatase 2C domain-containing protein [candidate division KSB1 bacterium]